MFAAHTVCVCWSYICWLSVPVACAGRACACCVRWLGVYASSVCWFCVCWLCGYVVCVGYMCLLCMCVCLFCVLVVCVCVGCVFLHSFVHSSASEHGSRNYALIFPNAVLWQLAEKTPLTVQEMKSNIDGLPVTKIKKYGAHRFLEVTSKYCDLISGESHLSRT